MKSILYLYVGLHYIWEQKVSIDSLVLLTGLNWKQYLQRRWAKNKKKYFVAHNEIEIKP